MTSPKVELFHKDLQTAASFFKALSHPARLAILNFLAEAQVCMTGDISNELPLSRTTVNQHLAELKDVGLITGEISGVKVNYCLNIKKIEELNKRFGEMIANLGCC
ncbi:MAG: helix-turn-helix transcriptional regulator [Bacteroidales bacterium]|nr:helix-turn-helix transcriptional regulator [Bacteroidales bacterium]